MKIKVLYFGLNLVVLLTNCLSVDPYESLSRKSPTGIPYYLRIPSPPNFHFTSTALLLLRFEASIGMSNDDPQPPKLWRNVPNRMGTIEPECHFEKLFPKYHMTNAEILFFIHNLNSTCFKNKFQQKEISGISADKKDQVPYDCESGRIPRSIVTPFQLEELLGGFENHLQSRGFHMAIPKKHIRAYYKLPLASCTSSENVFYVAIQVPVHPVTKTGSSQFQSYSIIPIPLWMPDEPALICRLEEHSSKTSFELEGKYFYNTKTREVLNRKDISCHTYPAIGRLCYLADNPLTLRSMRRVCIQALIETLDEDVVCEFKCEPADLYNLPIIRQVASDRYMIVTDLTSNEDIRVECPPFQKQESLAFPSTGTLEVVLPCDCHIRYRHDIFNATYPCASEFSKLPIQFPENYDNREVNSAAISF